MGGGEMARCGGGGDGEGVGGGEMVRCGKRGRW